MMVDVVTSPLVETKFYIPALRRGFVSRPRLSGRLSRSAEAKLTLISAPAGFGKTTLLAEWLADADAGERSVAWLSLEQNDNRAGSFWTYVIAAIQKAAPEVGATALLVLEAGGSPNESVLTALVNDLSALTSDVWLVLDDYHLIDSLDVQDGMVFLLEHQPPQMRLVIASRADPALPLAKLRARGELVEIRAADLRFTPEEAAAYLNDVMGLALTAQDVAALEVRTEGWIAALQLAALSMRGRDDVAAFIASFAGDDRYIVDYLAEEVLGRQPSEVRDFLLRTSILGRVSGPLSDAVLGRDGGKATLVALERANLFLVALDDRRQWYRYHHLFADVLQAHLLEEYGDDVPELHRRASVWFEHNAEPSEAIRHALSGRDFHRAADLMERAMPKLFQNRQEAEVRSWIPMLPDEVVRVRPVLGMGFVGALASGSEFDSVEERLQVIELLVGPPTRDGAGPYLPQPEAVVVDQEWFQSLPGNIEMYRSAQDLASGDLDGTVTHARQAMELAPPDGDLIRAGAAGLWGLASWTTGDLEAAHQAYVECVEGLQRVGHISDVLGCSITLADIRRTQGRLSDALHICESGLALGSRESGLPPFRGTADMHVGIGEILLERDDRDGAARHLAQSQELGEANGLPRNPYRWRVAMAALREAEGDLDAAVELLDEAERVYDGDYAPNVRPVPAVRARLRIRRGELSSAVEWVRARQLSHDDRLSYLLEFEHVTLARLLLARHATERTGTSLEEATDLLTRLLGEAERGGRVGTVLEVLVLQALAHQVRGDATAAITSLQRALILAEPEGYIRLFADEGPPMGNLLRALAKKREGGAYVRRLLGATTGTKLHSGVTQTLIEPLSEREIEVLRLLGTELDGPAIARQLVVSLNTVRTHTKNIYAKLGVNNRRAAVRRAVELHLLARTGEH